MFEMMTRRVFDRLDPFFACTEYGVRPPDGKRSTTSSQILKGPLVAKGKASKDGPIENGHCT
jgi:hypothetical protein